MSARGFVSQASLACLLLSSLAQQCIAAPPLLRHEINTLPTLFHANERRQSSGPYTAVTGIISNGTQPRIEIRDMHKNVDQWNIYMLGLASFMAADETDKLSFYQIAGIHGRPYIPWDNVGPFVGNTQGPGYCTHVSNIFLPWHRPYLALYEQQLYAHILSVVDTFPQGDVRNRYAQAASTWRHPYWDWATPAPSSDAFPSFFTAPNITVTQPNGTAVIPNPLFSFQFHPVKVADFYYNPFATWNETKRYPDSWQENASSQNNLVNGVLANNQQSLQQRLYNLFTNYDNFTEFSNEAWFTGSSDNTADSLESVHDVVHAIVGMSGHMTYLDYSAFDPVFWLHHTMVDRLFALFQGLHPDVYVEPMNAIEQTFTIAPHQDVDENTPLDPFHSDTGGTLYTSVTARDITHFGYTYPELQGNWTAASIRSAINNLYGASAGSKVIQSRELHARDAELQERASTIKTLSQLPGESTADGKRKQYILNLQSEKFAANGSYAVYVFMGWFNEEDPSTWALAPNLVGTHGVFTALPNDDASSGIQKRAMGSVLVTGTIPLTSKLLEKVQSGDLASMDDATVETYLQNNLHWKAALFDNTELPVDKVAGLDITVVRADVKPATSHDAFPTWGNFARLNKISGRSEYCEA